MATRYIGDAKIEIEYMGEDHGASSYAGKISVRERGGTLAVWRFSDVNAPLSGGPGHDIASDSVEAYDQMAVAAANFGGYYTTENRGEDTPDWAPPPDVADAIDQAISSAMDEERRGLYEVRRSPRGKGRFVG